MKHSKILILLIISVMLLTGCSEDTHELERNLYYDMEDINRYGLDFMEETLTGMTRGIFAKSEMQNIIKSMEDKVANLKPPKHLKSEVEDWVGHVNSVIDKFKETAQGEYTPLSKTEMEAFDYGTERIYDGFKEYEWK